MILLEVDAWDLPLNELQYIQVCLKLSGWHGSHLLFGCQSREIEKLKAIRSGSQFRVLFGLHEIHRIYMNAYTCSVILISKKKGRVSHVFFVCQHIVLNKYIAIPFSYVVIVCSLEIRLVPIFCCKCLFFFLLVRLQVAKVCQQIAAQLLLGKL